MATTRGQKWGRGGEEGHKKSRLQYGVFQGENRTLKANNAKTSPPWFVLLTLTEADRATYQNPGLLNAHTDPFVGCCNC